MSSGGGEPLTARPIYSTGATGGGNQVRIDSPASQQNGYGSAPAPGGKGGFPSAQNPYEQQPSVYMPPSQPSYYQQAFTQPRMEAPPRQYGLGGMGGGNAYARPYSPGSPIERAPPVDEMRYVSGPDFAPAVMPDTFPRARPAPTMPGMGLSDMRARMPNEYPARTRSNPFADMNSSNHVMPWTIPNQNPPVEATQAVMPEPNYSGGLGSLMGAGLSSNAQQQNRATDQALIDSYTGQDIMRRSMYQSPYQQIQQSQLKEGQQQNPAMAQHMSDLERQRAAIDARLNQVLPSGLTVGQQNAGWKVRPDGTFQPPGI